MTIIVILIIIYSYKLLSLQRLNSMMNSTRVLKCVGFQPLPTNKLQPLMEAVTTKGPVVVSIDAGGWNAYGGGIYVGSGVSEGKSAEDACEKDAVVNHAVVLIGYGHSQEDRKAQLRAARRAGIRARTIGTSEIAGETLGARAASSGCYVTAVTRETPGIAGSTGSPRTSAKRH